MPPSALGAVLGYREAGKEWGAREPDGRQRNWEHGTAGMWDSTGVCSWQHSPEKLWMWPLGLGLKKIWSHPWLLPQHLECSSSSPCHASWELTVFPGNSVFPFLVLLTFFFPTEYLQSASPGIFPERKQQQKKSWPDYTLKSLLASV